AAATVRTFRRLPPGQVLEHPDQSEDSRFSVQIENHRQDQVLVSTGVISWFPAPDCDEIGPKIRAENRHVSRYTTPAQLSATTGRLHRAKECGFHGQSFHHSCSSPGRTETPRTHLGPSLRGWSAIAGCGHEVFDPGRPRHQP